MFPFSKVTKSAKSLHPTVELYNLQCTLYRVQCIGLQRKVSQKITYIIILYNIAYYKAKI